MDASIFATIFDTLRELEGTAAYAAIFAVLLGCGLGVPIPEDVTLITAGYLAYWENIDLYWAIVIGFVGVLVGDIFLFMLGRHYGERILKWRLISFIITPERFREAKKTIGQKGKWVCFTARFLAGLRAPIFLTAGVLGVRPIVFVTMDALAALLSVPLITYIGFFFGGEIEVAIHYVRRFERYILIGLAILGFYFLLKTIISRINKREKLGP